MGPPYRVPSPPTMLTTLAASLLLRAPSVVPLPGLCMCHDVPVPWVSLPLSWGSGETSAPDTPAKADPTPWLQWTWTDKRDEAGPWALPAVMMSDRADTEADLGTQPLLGEALDFSGAGSLGPPRRWPRLASRVRGVECRAPALLLRRRA